MADQKEIYISFTSVVNEKTAEQFLGFVCNQVNQGIEKITLLLNSPGGQINYGFNIYNVLSGLPIELVTHNVGNTDSIGNVIFLAGNTRYACRTSTFMFHGAGLEIHKQTKLEQKNLKEFLSGLDADNKRIAEVVSSRTNIDAQKIRRWQGVGRTVDAEFAKEHGLVHDIKEVSIPQGVQVFQLVFNK